MKELDNRILLATLISTVLLSANFASTVSAYFPPQPPIDKDTLFLGTVGMPRRADPATAYDTPSGALIMNVYEPLIDFARNTSEPDPRKQGLVGQFVPRLAENWTKEVFILDLCNITVVDQTNPENTKWNDTAGKLYCIDGWRDNNVTAPDNNGTLGRCDVIYMVEIDPVTQLPIYCTEFGWHIELKEHFADGTIYLKVKRTWYVFKLRTNVKIHPWKLYDGTLVENQIFSPIDAEYSFERAMVQDRLAGPTWMLYKPTLDAMSAEDGWNLSDVNDVAELARLIDCAFQVNCTHFMINNCIDFPETAWYQILAQTWCYIAPKDFATNHGCWPGTFLNETGYPHWIYWRRWPTTTKSPLDQAPTTLAPPGYVGAVVPPGWNPVTAWAGHAEPPPILRGTGPYKFTLWDTPNQLWQIDKFAEYWKGWEPDAEHPYYIDTFISRSIPSWASMESAFLNGEIDIATVPRTYIYELLDPVTHEPLPGITCYKDLPLMIGEALHFQFEVTSGSPYMPTIGGINQSDFFSNIHARKTFAYALNFTTMIEDAWLGEAEQPATWHINGLYPDYRDPSIVKYALDLDKVRYHLKNANFSGGSLWETGFKTYLVYSSTTIQRIMYLFIENTIEGFNQERAAEGYTNPIVIDLVFLPWSDYINAMETGKLPTFGVDWVADFADVDNWARTYMHSRGYCASIQKYSNATVDIEIDLAVKTQNGPVRQAIYYDLQHTFINECPSLMIVQPLGRAWMRNWVQGWYYNPLHPGIPVRDIWKGFTSDLNGDLCVDLFDLVIVAAEFGKPPPPITDPRADVNKDGVVDIFDLVIIAAEFGTGCI